MSLCIIGVEAASEDKQVHRQSLQLFSNGSPMKLRTHDLHRGYGGRGSHW